jgi:hypothetical protein
VTGYRHPRASAGQHNLASQIQAVGDGLAPARGLLGDGGRLPLRPRSLAMQT